MDYTNPKRKDDYCIEVLLKLVSRGSSILAEILRMKNYIPEVYLAEETSKRYSNVIFDFGYLNKIDTFEDKIKNSAELRNIDEDFRESYVEILNRFYSIFNNIYKYVSDLDKYIDQLKQGIYVQFTLESMLTSKEARHLMCESIYLYGVMLLLVDRLIPGTVREKIIISYYRYSGQATIENINEVIRLFQTTGYVHSQGIKPKNYPVKYFERVPIDKDFLKMVIGTIKDNDIYDQIAAYPSPEHRSHALSTQASIVFVTLFFIHDYLESENSKMREIVDKHFSDNWNLSIYMGYTCDIIDWWKDCKAAKNALSITITIESVKSMSKNNLEKLNSNIKKLEKFYYAGSMNEDYVLDNIQNLLSIMREANVVLRWYLLQLTTTVKKYKEIIQENIKSETLISLLLAVAHFENNLKNMFQRLIESKDKMWNEDKENSLFRLKELAEYFAGNKNFGKKVTQQDFKEFFEKNITNLENLKLQNSTVAGRKIVIMKEGLENIKKYHYVDANLQIKQYINEIIEYLNHMLRVANIKNKILINIAQISDFSYAWITIQDYYKVMQQSLKKNSNNILYLKSIFLKLASILNFPLIRLFESDSPDIESVTNHYSSELVNFVRKVLQIVPISVFKLLEQIINVYNNGFKEAPIKILKNDIKDYAQLDERYLLAKTVHEISLYTKGILAMEKTFVGIIEVDPKEILEDGIRRELLGLLASNFHSILDITSASKITLSQKLKELSSRVLAIKRAFIYIQDYINIDGSRIWNEELHRLINCLADVEANKFLVKKINVEMKYNLEKFPIEKPQMPKDEPSFSFLGRLLRYIISTTKSKVSIFQPNMLTWNDPTGKEIFSLKTIKAIKESMGIEGFQGLNRLCSYHNYSNIVNLSKIYEQYLTDKSNSKSISQLAKLLNSPLIFEFADKEVVKTFFTLIGSYSKGLSNVFFNSILNIGHFEILKTLFNHSLKETVEYDSNCLFSQVQNFNRISLLNARTIGDPIFEVKDQAANQVKGKNKTPTINLYNYYNILNDILYDFSLADNTFYHDLSRHNYLVMILALLTYTEITTNYSKDKSNSIVRRAKTEDFSFIYLIVGVKVLLNQMGRKNCLFFFALIDYFRKAALSNLYSLKDFKPNLEQKMEIPENLLILDYFINEIANYLYLTEQELDLVTGIKVTLR